MTTPRTSTPGAPLPDAGARDTILNRLDRNLVVEAAAGTGKTTCLVGRLMTLLRRGALAGESRLAAVTFTHKAAAELRERLNRELRAALAGDAELDPAEAATLEAAAARLADCHIGTIHSFCARMLRERPVEAGVGPDFRELDRDADKLLRRRAWQQFADEMTDGLHPEIHAAFLEYGLDHSELADGFVTFAEYPDVAGWPGSLEAVEVDAEGFIEALGTFHASLEELCPNLHRADPGKDELIPAIRTLYRRLPRLPRPAAVSDAHRLCSILKEKCYRVQGQWGQFGYDKKQAKAFFERYDEVYNTIVRPFRDDCLAVLYRSILEAYRLCQARYDRMRREQGLLNFQDLLMLSARMLRDFPEVRADLGARYARLLVDEVQDTDPIQAEIMFLLAAEDIHERDWRRATPRPGSLFIVGDPKQSIYRFRRADIVVYQEVKRLIAESGGMVVGLTSNFRSQPEVVEWVNATFGPDERTDGMSPEAVALSGRFGRQESRYGPGYIPLQPALPAAGTDCLSGVYALELLKINKKAGVYEADTLRDEAARIAAFIRHAVDSGAAIPERDGGLRPARAGDFLVVTYTKGSSAMYVDALRRAGLPCAVTSGGTLQDLPAIDLLLAHTRAMAEPDNSVLTAAVLRQSFGMADTELYRWKQAGGTFSFLDPVPEGVDSPIAGIMTMLSEHHRRYRRLEPVTALASIADDLGLWAYSCLGDDPSTAAGAVASVIELLRAEQPSTVGALAELLAWYRDYHEEDVLPARPAPEDAVRVMNLHKTKGLEAPVVFLTTTRTTKSHKPTFAIRREDGAVTGGLAIHGGGGRGKKILARPRTWDEMADEESLFLAAERTRLNYVATTRAGAMLVVSIHHASGAWQSRFLPECIHGVTIPDTLPEPPPVRAAAATRPLSDLVVSPVDGRGRAERRDLVTRPSYRLVRAKPETDWGWQPRGDGALSPEDAMNLGEVLHGLLQSPGTRDRVREHAGMLLAAYQLPSEWLDEVTVLADKVWQSPVWQRAEKARQVFREAPYTLCREVDGMETLERGVIDLVFREEAGWVIVDYKSDTILPAVELAEQAKRHAGQLAAYAEAWKAITGEDVVETGIYYLRAGAFVTVATESGDT